MARNDAATHGLPCQLVNSHPVEHPVGIAKLLINPFFHTPSTYAFIYFESIGAIIYGAIPIEVVLRIR